MQSVNPATAEVIQVHAPLSDAALEARIADAHANGREWARRSVQERADVVNEIANVLEAQRESLAALVVAEMGKPVTQALAEVDKCALACRYFAKHGPAFLANEPVDVGGPQAYVAYRPLGTVLAILPWNFPLWQAIRFAAPALIAGNPVLLKPALCVIGCGQAIERVLVEAGVPHGLVPSLSIEDSRVETVIRDARVAAVTLTGSDRAGRAVAAIAGSELKKVVLELGGSDPYVVLADADLGVAVEAVVRSRLNNGGQSCIGAKRIIVESSVAEAFMQALQRELAMIEPGDPMDPQTRLGPMARVDLRDGVHDQVQRCIEAGATLKMGGVMPERAGFWYPLTLLSEVSEQSPAFEEEIFGPVFAVCSVRDREEALRLANASEFGLGAAIFTRDVERGAHAAEVELEAGSCFVNAAVRSDPRLPFGGIKRSGYGRELSRHGILEFVNTKTIWVE